ncbi:GNAT family N-acetyltransferase [Qipengyuania sp. RANM35]|uniref:GNAT family N-acetyltransferase n=1 Tax=Qipengyuania sp. RANM35 TaxID=3068635 RepID=UPI0034DABCD7
MGLADPVATADRAHDGVAAPLGLRDGFHALPWNRLDLATLQPHWQRLTDCASTPNPFFEPWYLRPALEAFDPGGSVMLLLLVADAKLVGLVPHHQANSYHARSIPNCAIWMHHNAFLGSPLVAAGHEADFWSNYLAWCDRTGARMLFLHLPQQPRYGELAAALDKVCKDQRRSLRTVMEQKRALLSSDLTAAQYREEALTAKKRKELRRQYKRLGELGALELIRSHDGAQVDYWIADFLALEARGWKGNESSALSSNPETEHLFRSAIESAARMGRLERLSLTLDGRPIAMLATFLAGRGAFSFKTAYDEDLARFSPGVQLQLANLDLLDDPTIEWCDSCAAQDHAMIDHIWRERREIVWQSVAIGRGPRRWVGEAWIKLEEWRWSRRK